MTLREMARCMKSWNYTAKECLEGFAYCKECGVDPRELEPWQFEDFVLVANGLFYVKNVGRVKI